MQAMFRFYSIFAAILCAGCAAEVASLPAWMTHRPENPAYLYGVGTCGRTLDPDEARILAVERAVWEICCQAGNSMDYEIAYKEEDDAGRITVEIRAGGRLIRTLANVEVVDQAPFIELREGRPEESMAILVRVGKEAVRF